VLIIAPLRVQIEQVQRNPFVISSPS